jgi:hypothetical protein
MDARVFMPGESYTLLILPTFLASIMPPPLHHMQKTGHLPLPLADNYQVTP